MPHLFIVALQGVAKKYTPLRVLLLFFSNCLEFIVKFYRFIHCAYPHITMK